MGVCNSSGKGPFNLPLDPQPLNIKAHAFLEKRSSVFAKDSFGAHRDKGPGALGRLDSVSTTLGGSLAALRGRRAPQTPSRILPKWPARAQPLPGSTGKVARRAGKDLPGLGSIVRARLAAESSGRRGVWIGTSGWGWGENACRV